MSGKNIAVGEAIAVVCARQGATMSNAKRIGRPFKSPVEGKRTPLSLLVRPEIKRLVDARAKANSRTQSQEAEMMIERALVYDDLLAALRIVGDRLIRLNPHDDL